MRCRDCKFLKSKSVGYVSAVHWCGLVGDGYSGSSIGVNPWKGKPHPRCPIEHPEFYRKGNSGKLFPKEGAAK